MKYLSLHTAVPSLAACWLGFFPNLVRSAEDTPSAAALDRAMVTIPYSELRALWEAGHAPKEAPAKKEVAPPVPYLIDRVECDLHLADGISLMEASFEVERLEAGWQRIPLLDGGAQLTEVEPKEQTVACDDGYALLGNQPGKAAVTLHLTCPGIGAFTHAGALHLKLPAATVKRLQISGIPAGFEARVDGSPAQEMKDGAATAALPGAAGEVVIELAARTIPQPEPPEQPSHWQVETQVLVQMEEGRLRLTCHAFAQADGGSGSSAQLILPAKTTGLTISGEDLADWKAAAEPDGRRRITLRWKTRGTLDRRLNIEYALPEAPLAAVWKLEAPESGDGGETKCFYAMIPGDGLELKGAGWKAAVESQRLPQWMREIIGGAPFASAEGGAQFSVEPHWLPEIPTAEAMVENAKCSLRVVADGAQRGQVTYTISHQGPMAWKVELPAKVQLLACEIDGARAHPHAGPDGIIELNLPAAKGAKPVSTVTLIYTAAGKPLDPVSGQIAMELPRTELFIDHLEWDISIPAAYEPTAVNGNLSIAVNGADDQTREERVITLRKDLCRGERPATEVYYQRITPQK